MYEDQNTDLEQTVAENNTVIEPIAPQVSPLSPEEKDIKLNSQIAAASYVWLLSVPIFLFRKDSPFIQRHAKQGLYLFGLSLVFWFVATWPYIGGVGFIMLIFYVFYAVKGFISAFNGKYCTIPFLTDYLEKGIVPDIVRQAQEFTEKKTEDVTRIIKAQVNEEKETADEISSQVHNVLDDSKKE